MTTIVQRKVREGYIRPKLPRESVEQGYTGETCRSCGSLTVKVKVNFTHKYLECEDCGDRVAIGPK